MNILWDRVEALIEEHQTSIYAVQKATGLSAGTISKWETSSKPTATGDSILRVANYFDVSVDYLLGNTDNPQSHKNDPTQFAPAARELTKALGSLLTTVNNTENEIRHILENYHLDSDLEKNNEKRETEEAGDSKEE